MKRLFMIMALVFSLFVLGACKTPEKGDFVNVTVILHDGEKEVSSKQHKIAENSSAFELLDEFYELEYDESEFGVFVNTITIGTITVAGSNESQTFLAFIVNGESSMVGVSSYFVKDNDVLTFKVTGW